MGCVIVISKSRKSVLKGYVNSLLLPPTNLKGIARLYNDKKLFVISMFLATIAVTL